MALSSWLCASNTKSMMVKIVHPGGRVELHDHPMMAAEIMVQNPKCYVTYPQVFCQPWAVLSPDSVLLLGHKYYVVPVGTLRKLQRIHPKRSDPSPTSFSPNSPISTTLSPNSPSLSPSPSFGYPHREDSFWCRLFSNNKDMIISSKAPYSSLSKSSDKEGDDDDRLRREDVDRSCLTFLFLGSKGRAKEGTSSRDEPRRRLQLSPSETREHVIMSNIRRNVGDGAKGVSMEHWKPNLESIDEEYPF